MSVLVIPNVLVNGLGPANLVDATGLNANFNAIATAVNNIYPSQILPITSGQATFGATATSVAYKFSANDATAIGLIVSSVSAASANTLQVNMGASQSVTGLLVNGAASITGNIFEVDLTSGGQKALWVNSVGILNTAQTASTGQLGFGNGTTAQTGGLVFTSNTLKFFAQSSTALYAAVNADGTLQLQPTINATNTLGRVPPCYLSNGATVASTFHIVKDVINATTGSTNIPLTGAAAFSDALNYSILIWDESTPGTLINPSASAAGSFTFPSTNGHTYAFLLVGF